LAGKITSKMTYNALSGSGDATVPIPVLVLLNIWSKCRALTGDLMMDPALWRTLDSRWLQHLQGMYRLVK